jgi:hypothetical protein
MRAAKERGALIGRPRKLSARQITRAKRLINSGKRTRARVAEDLGVHVGTLSRANRRRLDTLMQDRLPPARRNLLATHGRTIHLSGPNSAFAFAVSRRSLQVPCSAGLDVMPAVRAPEGAPLGQLIVVSNRVALPERSTTARAGGLEFAVDAALKQRSGSGSVGVAGLPRMERARREA